MRLKVAELTKHRDTTYLFDFFMPLGQEGESGLLAAEPVKVEGEAVYLGPERGILIEGQYAVLARSHCHRCLKEFDLPLSGDFREEVELADSETCLSEEDTACRREMLDLKVLAREHLLLSLPLKFLCREDCRGICPGCGRELYEADCECRGELLDPRLEKLKELLPDSEGEV